MRSRLFSAFAGRFISLRMRGLACWNGTSRYGRQPLPSSAISGMTSSTCGYGIDVVQAHPGAVLGRELAERAHELGHPRLERPPAPEAGAIADVDAVGARVLRDDQQLAHAGLEQVLRLVHHFADRAADEIAAHRRDDAEACSGGCSLR